MFKEPVLVLLASQTMLFQFQAACVSLDSNANPHSTVLGFQDGHPPHFWARCPTAVCSYSMLLGVWQSQDNLGFIFSETTLWSVAGCYWSIPWLLFARRNKLTPSVFPHTTEYPGSYHWTFSSSSTPLFSRGSKQDTVPPVALSAASRAWAAHDSS